MSELVIPSVPSSISVSQDRDTFNEISKNAEYFTRLVVCGSNTKQVQSGLAQLGDIIIVTVQDNFINLGKTVNCWVTAWRPKALMLGDSPVSFYDPKSKEFQSVREKSFLPDSGCMFGPEYLLYVPQYGFTTYHMASKTARNVAPSVQALLESKKPMTLTAELIIGKKHRWHGPKVCESAIAPETPPDAVKFQELMTKFLNPKSQEVEIVNSTATDRG